MRFASADHAGRHVAVAVTDRGLLDASGLLAERDSLDPIVAIARLIVEEGIEESDLADLPVLPEAEVRIAPLVRRPGKIVAAPVNYEDHQEEMKQAAHVSALGFFLKSPTSVLAHGDVVQLPYDDRRFDQEGELAVVIGRGGRDIPEDRVHEHIAGYTCLLDITMRGGEDRSTRKSFDTFTPVGPHLVTKDEVGDLSDVTLRCAVDGVVRQDADISSLIWGVERFVSYVSSVTTLEAGDIITTGTPAGVGEIACGNRIEVTIDRIGTLAVAVSAERAVACPPDGATSGPRPPATITPVRTRDSGQ